MRISPGEKADFRTMMQSFRSYSNDRAQNMSLRYVGNKVTTAKYNIITFLPRNLFEQFSRLANDYFLIISALQLFTPLSPTSRFSTAGPFAVILFLNMVREVWEDSKRHFADAEVNNRQVDLVTMGDHTQIAFWKEILVGDIVQVSKNKEFPADLILLASSGDQGMSYIDTCNLDGETNLKIRNSLDATKKMDSPAKISQLSGYFEYEPPNNRLYNFTGKLILPNGEEHPVDNDNILLRGSTLRNTDWILGQVIYTGAQSKIMMNAQKGRLKQSNVEHVVNYLLIGILFFELIVVSIATIGMGAWVDKNRDAWYLPYVATQTARETSQGWVTFLILLNNYVPISLYISLEIAKSIQGQQINWDLEMYHPDTDTPALTRTTNLNEELGQIQYIFSDKTGTLTQNVMEFRKCYIAGRSYGFGTTEIGRAAVARGAIIAGMADPTYQEAERSANPDQAQFHRDPRLDFGDCRLLHNYRAGGPEAAAIQEFLRVLSVGHTVVPEGDMSDPVRAVYQAESPDEGALVSFARAMGWFFCGRSSAHCAVRVLGVDQRFEVLNVNKFNSSRKRMSVVCRTPEGRLTLYCKGADNVMLERLRGGPAANREMAEQLAAYATEGLRTLVLASRVLTEEEWARWDAVHRAATTALQDREGALERAAEEVEVDMEVVGATAIEDKLQDGVPEAIATLARAKIKIWVLTGDKQETAENIGFACQLLRDDMTISYVNGADPPAVESQIKAASAKLDAAQGGSPLHPALIVDGKALTAVSEGALEPQLLALARRCEAVVACRVSPGQKRDIVAMVRAGVHPEPMTLAVGDGANDVPMITEAHVGVGISGNEGMQAVRSADYAIAQFRYLKRLVLVHGRNNYRRVAVVILYSLYKQMAFVTSLFLFNSQNGWSGTPVYDSWIMVGFNALYTFLPPIVYGFMEQDVCDHTALQFPQLYLPGQAKENFNFTQLFVWLANGLVHCVLVFSLPFAWASSSRTVDLGVLGTTAMWALSLVANLRLVLEENHISLVSHVAVFVSVLVFYLWALLLGEAWSLVKNFDNYYAVARQSFGDGQAWLVVAVTVVAMTGLDVAAKYAHRMYRPSATYAIQEWERGGRLAYRSLRDAESPPAAPLAPAPRQMEEVRDEVTLLAAADSPSSSCGGFAAPDLHHP